MKTIFLSSLFCAALAISCSEPVETAFPETGLAAQTNTPQRQVLDSLVTLPYPDTSPVVQAPPPNDSFTSREALVTFARQFLGTPYIYAASDPEKGFDCSGFIYYVYHHFGFQVPRSSIDFKTFGREIPLAAAQTGDLLLFTGVSDSNRIGHIGIVLQGPGDAAEFIHASSGKEMAVTISSVAAPHYRKRFVKAIDVLSK